MIAVRRLFLVALLAIVPAACSGGGGDSGANTTTLPSPDATRLAGDTDAATAAAVSAARFPSASDVVIASPQGATLAFTAAYVAGSHQSPILLVDRDGVPDVTLQELRRLGAYHARVIGGADAIGTEVDDELRKAGLEVERIAGTDPIDAAADLAASSGPANVGVYPGAGTTVFLTAPGHAEALLAAPLSYSQQWPVLLTPPGLLAPRVRDALGALAVRHVIVLGGVGVVSQAVVDEVVAMGLTAERIDAGTDPAAMGPALADLARRIGVPEPSSVDVAAASGPLTALVAGPHAGAGAPLLLCLQPDDCGAATIGWLEAHRDTVTRVVVIGPRSAVSEHAQAALEAAAR